MEQGSCSAMERAGQWRYIRVRRRRMDKWNGHRSKIEESGFQAAVPVWGTGLREKYNQFLGFYTKVDLDEEQEQ